MDTWVKTFWLFCDDNELGGSSRWKVTPDTVLNFIRATIESEVTKTLDLIAEKEGWEESRDKYANMLGLPTKYTDVKVECPDTDEAVCENI